MSGRQRALDARQITRALTPLVVLLVVVSGFAPASVAVASAEGGMVGVPDSSITSNVPDHATDELPGADAFRGDVMVSEGASTLQFNVTTRAQANGRSVSCPTATTTDLPDACAAPDLALVLSDSSNHEDRDVAVNRSAVISALGYEPDIVYVEHESGDQYAVPVTQEGELLKFHVKEFSTNTVTFAGTVNLNGNPAANGAQYTYEINDLDSVANYTINVTGNTATAWDNESALGVSNGDTMSLAVAGTAPPSGPSANGEPTVEFTGIRTEKWRNATGNAHDGQSPGITVMGNRDPVGPSANNKPVIELTGRLWEQSDYDMVNDEANKLFLESDQAEHEINNPPDTVDKLKYRTTTTAGDITGCTIWLNTQEADGQTKEGTKVASSYNPSETDGNHTVDITDYSTGGAAVLTVETSCSGSGGDRLNGESSTHPSENMTYTTVSGFEKNAMAFWAIEKPSGITVADGQGNNVSFSSFSVGQTKSKELPVSRKATSLTFKSGGGAYDYRLEKRDINQTESPSVDLGDDGTTEASVSGFLNDGETVAKEVSSLDTATSKAGIGLSGGDVDVAIKFEERTESVDPSVEVNGKTTSYTGTLSDGSTVTLNSNTTWVQNGTNRVNVSVSTGVSADAPTGQVGLMYEHEAQTNQTVDYQGETWSERYNVSKTFASDQSNAQLRIPFASDRVISVRDAEIRKNGGTWSDVSSSAQSFDGSELVVDIGSVNAGDTYEIRANGSKVVVSNGEIRVTHPTTAGNELNTTFEIVSKSSGFHISVAGTQSGQWLHYTTEESWSSPSEYAVVDSEDHQEMYFPNAASGSTARIQTIPLDVGTKSGDAQFEVRETGYTPEVKVYPGRVEGQTVTWKWAHRNLETDQKYILYDKTHDKQIDSDVAQSPVFFESSDSEALFNIFEENTTSSGGGGGTGGGGGATGEAEAIAETILTNPVFVAPIGMIALLGVVVLFRRTTEVSSTSELLGNRLFQLVAGVIVVGTFGQATQWKFAAAFLSEPLAPVTRILLLAAGGVAIGYVYLKYVKGADTPQKVTKVAFKLGSKVRRGD